MDQLGNVLGAVKPVADGVHAQVTILGLEPVPTAIVVVMAALFGLVGLVVGGSDRGRRGAHRAR